MGDPGIFGKRETEARTILRKLFDPAVASVDPRIALAAHLPEPPAGRCVGIGAGKSAAAMARAVELS